MRIKYIIPLILAILFISRPSLAQENEQKQEDKWGPIGLVYAPYEVKGVFISVSPFGNFAQKITGLQIGLGASAYELKGIHIGLGGSYGKMTGLQASVGLNQAQTAKGVQISIGGNAADYFTMSGVDLKGAQIGALNIAKEGSGLQVGVVNLAKKFEGVQIGIINGCRSMYGVQLGALNFITESPVPFFPLANMNFNF